MRNRVKLLATAGLLLLSAPAAWAADAGSVIFVKGDVTAERQPPVALAKGEAVLPGDTVATGEASRAQLLMADGAKIAIRPNSRLVIEEFSYTEPSSGQSVVSTSSDRSVLRLVKGGFRTITGAIGKEDRSDYEVRTPVGVLGIRGTDFGILVGPGSGGGDDESSDNSSGTQAEEGLYVAVFDGGVTFRTAVATIDINAGEYVFIPLQSQQPRRLPTLPPVFIDDNDFRPDSTGNAGASRPQDGSADDSRLGFDERLGTRRSPPAAKPGEPSSERPGTEEDGSREPPSQPVFGTDPDGRPVDITPGEQPAPRDNRSISFSTGNLGTLGTAVAAVSDNDPSQYRLDQDFNLLGFRMQLPGRTAPVISDLDIGTSNNTDTGFDTMTVMRWGRWSGGAASASGSTEPVDLGNQSLHWIQSPDLAPPTMPVTGVANYRLTGSTSPTDNRGNVGTLGDASFFADFTNMRVDSALDVSIGGSTWSATGTGNIGPASNLPAHLFRGGYNVSVNGIGGGTGTFSGFFSEPGPTSDPAFPGGVGLTYSLQDAGATSIVSGAAAFGDP